MIGSRTDDGEGVDELLVTVISAADLQAIQRIKKRSPWPRPALGHAGDGERLPYQSCSESVAWKGWSSSGSTALRKRTV